MEKQEVERIQKILKNITFKYPNNLEIEEKMQDISSRIYEINKAISNQEKISAKLRN